MVKQYESIYDILQRNKIQSSIIENDVQAWIYYESKRHLYNKLWICESQDIAAAPLGIYPKSYPIVFKPIINLYGMSKGFKIIYSIEDYDKNIDNGLFWMKYLNGKHYSIDLVILDGKIKAISTFESFASEKGTFEHHKSIPEYKLSDKNIKWIEKHLHDYIGCINLEIIDDVIIEAHLRLNGDFYLFDDQFVLELNKLYENKLWNDDYIYKCPQKYIFPIFVYKDINKNKLDQIKKEDIYQICDTFNANSIRFDDTSSIYQSEYYSRYLIFDINDYNEGCLLKKKINDFINCKLE